MREMGECAMYWIGKWWQRRKDLLYGKLMDGFWCPNPTPIMNSWTVYITICYHIFLSDLFVN